MSLPTSLQSIHQTPTAAQRRRNAQHVSSYPACYWGGAAGNGQSGTWTTGGEREREGEGGRKRDREFVTSASGRGKLEMMTSGNGFPYILHDLLKVSLVGQPTGRGWFDSPKRIYPAVPPRAACYPHLTTFYSAPNHGYLRPGGGYSRGGCI